MAPPPQLAKWLLRIVSSRERDEGFLDTFEIEVVAGRGFSQAIRTDVTDAVMLNETAVRAA